MKKLANVLEYVHLNATGSNQRTRAFQEALRVTQQAKTTKSFVKIVRELWEHAHSDVSKQAYYDILWYALEEKP